MIIAGIDFGDARTGIAVCDKYEMMASEAGCVQADSYKKALAMVAEKMLELKAELIVVGNPRNMNGSEGPRSEKCRAFARELAEATGIETVLFDERLTTVSAHKILSENNVKGKKRKATVDALSARLILEDYLAVRKNTGKAGTPVV
ncbi:MAG: Holliday junction resolvase RuvX [Clostridia bacterium]|nr:Holliday junction resolvase RuvX [Clostridia bacterium]